MSSRVRSIVYLVLAAAGAVGTWAYNLRFSAEHGGFDLWLWVRAPFGASASASLAIDFYVSMVAGLVMMIAEARRIRMRRVWLYVALLGVAWATAFPLFLFARERHLARAREHA
jgi:hypothetical protein